MGKHKVWRDRQGLAKVEVYERLGFSADAIQACMPRSLCESQQVAERSPASIAKPKKKKKDR